MIEEEMYVSYYECCDHYKAREVEQKEREYKEKARELLSNLKKYDYLCDDLLSGKLNVETFVNLSAKELKFENTSPERKAELNKKVEAEYMHLGIPWSDAVSDNFVLKRDGCYTGGNHEDDGSF